MAFILGTKIPDIPYVVAQWRREQAGEALPDGLILTQPWPAGPRDQRRDLIMPACLRNAPRVLHGFQIAADSKGYLPGELITHDVDSGLTPD